MSWHSVLKNAAVGLFAVAIVIGSTAFTRSSGAREVQGSRPTEASTVTITEGTNFAVAAHRGARTVVMDLLGSLWAVPIEGGAAKKITEELIEARHPSFAPDGRAVVFQGFKDNDGWDLWSIAPDGSAAKRLTRGPFDDMEPAWSHDGTRVAFSSDRSRNYDIWVLDIKSGDVRRITSDTAQESAPAWSPDGLELAFVRQPTAPPGTPPPSGATLMAVNLESGAERQLGAVEGRIGPPTWTSDGTQLVYTVIAEGASRLEMGGKPLVSGEDIFPGRVQWLSDTEFLYTADGKIKKRIVGGGASEPLEFTATFEVKPGRYAQKRSNFDAGPPRKALGIVRPVIRPDGTQVAFAALGDLWVMPIGATPKRVTNDQFIDTDPSWSPDGTQLVFSSDRAEMGNLDLWIVDVGSGADRRLTTTPHADFGANWSPNGTRLAFLSMLPHQMGAAVCVVDVKTGKLTELWRSAQRIPSYPTWSADGKTLFVSAFDQYSPRFREGIWKPLLIPVAGGEPQWIDVTPNVSLTNGVDEGPVWSPDGASLALAHEGLLKVMAVENGKPTGQFKQLTAEPVQSPSWTSDSKRILYLATDQLKIVSVDDGRVTEVPLELTYQSNIPQVRRIVHAAHLWNGRDTSLRHDVDITIEANRIKAVEPHSSDRHAGVEVVDASNQTVIPGLVDMHGHIYREYGEAAGRLLLAYGVTGVRDPAGMGYRCIELKESSEAGARIGPRFYFSGPPLDGARGAFAEMYSVYSMERLERELVRTKRLEYDLLKMYVRLPLAMQKRVVEFGQQNGLPMVSHFIYPAGMWGSAGTEHTGGRTSALGNVYNDNLQLFMKSGIQWCPTLAVTGGYDLVAADDASYLEDVRLKKLSPEWALEPSRLRLERVKKAGTAVRAQSLQRTGKAFTALTRAGIPLLAGTDSPNMPNGVGLHAELELLVRAGLTPVEALKTATINAADALGNGADLGSIEPGKVADMVILDGDPLTDIKNTRKVNAVLKNGNVYTLDVLLSGSSGRTTSPSGGSK